LISPRWYDRQDGRATPPQPREVHWAEVQRQRIAAVELVTAPPFSEMTAPCQGLQGAGGRAKKKRSAGAELRDTMTAATRNARACPTDLPASTGWP